LNDRNDSEVPDRSIRIREINREYAESTHTLSQSAWDWDAWQREESRKYATSYLK